MTQLFQEIRPLLLQYKGASKSARQSCLDAIVNQIKNLPQTITNSTEAIKTCKIMAFAATLINYADALQRIEQQDYFEILIDFRMPEVFSQPPFVELKTYFEFHTTYSQMRLKKPIADIPLLIWQLFRKAQKVQLTIHGLEDIFNIDELDIHNLPHDQLYPLPIQMMAAYNNESVDRINVGSNGKYRFAKRFDYYFLPGGGMVEIHLEKNKDTLTRKLLDEHLEEEQGNLWLKAKTLYNAISKDKFEQTLQRLLTKHKIMLSSFSNKTNAEILTKAIQTIDHLNPMTFEEKKRLTELRATIQVELFKLTPLYQQAFNYIEANSTLIQIEQFGDTRACGGKQISNCFLMTGQPLEEWFSEQFQGAECEFADDLTGSKVEHLTLLEALTKFRAIKFSHLLIVLAQEIQCLDKKILDVDKIWQQQEYVNAKHALVTYLQKHHFE
jgi:CheY-like chemotaxis protein